MNRGCRTAGYLATDWRRVARRFDDAATKVSKVNRDRVGQRGLRWQRVARDRARLRPALVCLDGGLRSGRLGGVSRSLTWSSTEMSRRRRSPRCLGSWAKSATTRALERPRWHGEREDGASKLSGSMARATSARGVGHLLTQRRCAARPQPVGIVHLLLRKPSGAIHSRSQVWSTARAVEAERTPWRRSRLVALSIAPSIGGAPSPSTPVSWWAVMALQKFGPSPDAGEAKGN